LRLAPLDTAAYSAYPSDVLNGTAWDSDMNRIFVTGKLWPKLFEINYAAGK
jgi:glutamine cyclotransferase